MTATMYKKGVEDLEGRAPFGSGECVALPQALTDIGHTIHWYPDSRVVDLAYLNEGTVIANFVFTKPGVGRFPNKHGYHVAFFVACGPRGMNSGQRSIIVIDQWIGRPSGSAPSAPILQRTQSNSSSGRPTMPANFTC